MTANMSFSFVDVRDVARIHVGVIGHPESVGERYLAVAGMGAIPKLAKLLAATYPDRRIATRAAPDWVIRLMARFMPDMEQIAVSLGRANPVTGQKAASELGFEYISVEDAVLASAQTIDAKLSGQPASKGRGLPSLAALAPGRSR